MPVDNRSYYRARAEQERTTARNSTDPRIAAVHDELADRYFIMSNQSAEEEPQAPDQPVGVPGGGADNFHRSRRSGSA
jgi:hypothetical protein